MALLKNELIKIFSQMSFKITMILVLIIALIIPYFFNITNSFFGYSNPTNIIEEYYKYYLSILDTYDGDEGSCDIAYEIANYESQAKVAEFYLNNANEPWKYNIYKDGACKEDLFTLIMACKAIDIFGKYGNQAANNYYVNYLDTFLYDWLGNNIPLIEFEYVDEEYAEDKEIYDDYRYSDVDFSKIDFASAKNEVESQIKTVKEAITALNPKSLMEDEKAIISEQLTTLNEQLTEANKIYNADKTEENKRAVTILTNNIEQNKHIIEIYDLLIQAGKTPDDWQYRAIRAMDDAIGFLNESLYVSEKEYNEDEMLKYDGFLSVPFPNYNEYKNAKEKDYDNIKAGIDIIMTAVRENTELPIFIDKSSKTTVISSMSTQIQIIGLFTVILSALTVSSEYSSGTIRLLLIRPKKREKILASKYGAVLICSLGLTIVSFILISCITMLQIGVTDFFANDIFRLGGKNIVFPSLCGFGIRLILDFFKITLLAAITILIAILVKKSALSITFPMILLFISGIAQIFIPALTVANPVLKYTILPYFNLTSLFVSPVNIFSDSEDILQLLFGNISVTGALRLSLPLGTLIYAIHIVIITWLSSIAFKKQQI